MRLLLDSHDITTLPYSKEENAIVERANKEVMRHLRAFIFDKKILENWIDSLPMVMRIINSTPHSSLGGVSPAELLFGNVITLDRKLYHDLPSSTNMEGVSSNMRGWIDQMLSMQARLIDIARKFQREKDEKHIASGETGHLTEFAIGSYVLARYPETGMGKRPPTKLHTPWRGPYRVVNRNASTYTLQDLVSLDTFNVHISTLKEFEYDPNRTDVEAAAMADKQYFGVERIIKHFGNTSKTAKKSQLTFQVKWIGEEKTTREPWSHLRNNAKLHQYLASKPSLHHLIPKAFL